MAARKINKSYRTNEPLTTNQLAILARLAEDDAQIHLNQIKAQVEEKASKCLTRNGELDKETIALAIKLKKLEVEHTISRVMMNVLVTLGTKPSGRKYVYDARPSENVCRRAQLSAAFTFRTVAQEEQEESSEITPSSSECGALILPSSSSKSLKRKKRASHENQDSFAEHVSILA